MIHSSLQDLINIIDAALAKAPGTREEHVERTRALQVLLKELASAQKKVLEYEKQDDELSTD